MRSGRPTRKPAPVLGALIKGLIALFSLLPLRAARGLTSALARVGWWVGTEGKRNTLINLAHCQPQLDANEREQLAWRATEQTAWLFAEQGAVWHWPESRWQALIDEGDGQALLGRQHPERNASAPGTLLLAPHLGNWELFSLYLGRFGVTALYDPPRLMSLDAPIRRARERAGATLLPIDRRGLKGLLNALDDGGLVALLPDQVPDRQAGVYAPFFGQPALTMTLAHRLIQRSKPRVVVGAMLRDGSGFRLVVEPLEGPIFAEDPVVSAKAMNQAMESLIARAPEQYQWGYKRFKRQPVGSRKLY